MTKKLKPAEDPAYFEWEPNEEAVSDSDILESFKRRGVDPEDIRDLKFRKKYLKYLETHQK